MFLSCLLFESRIGVFAERRHAGARADCASRPPTRAVAQAPSETAEDFCLGVESAATAAKIGSASVRSSQSGCTSAKRTTPFCPITSAVGCGSSHVPVPVISPMGLPLASEDFWEGSSNVYRMPNSRAS